MATCHLNLILRRFRLVLLKLSALRYPMVTSTLLCKRIQINSDLVSRFEFSFRLIQINQPLIRAESDWMRQINAIELWLMAANQPAFDHSNCNWNPFTTIYYNFSYSVTATIRISRLLMDSPEGYQGACKFCSLIASPNYNALTNCWNVNF